jgi:hypothetical protein
VGVGVGVGVGVDVGVGLGVGVGVCVCACVHVCVRCVCVCPHFCVAYFSAVTQEHSEADSALLLAYHLPRTPRTLFEALLHMHVGFVVSNVSTCLAISLSSLSEADMFKLHRSTLYV